jgi:hypothetical protein
MKNRKFSNRSSSKGQLPSTPPTGVNPNLSGHSDVVQVHAEASVDLNEGDLGLNIDLFETSVNNSSGVPSFAEYSAGIDMLPVHAVNTTVNATVNATETTTKVLSSSSNPVNNTSNINTSNSTNNNTSNTTTNIPPLIKLNPSVGTAFMPLQKIMEIIVIIIMVVVLLN